MKTLIEPDNDEYKIIQKYLLNDSPLYGYNRPKLWIHTTYDVNSRKWRDFYSRNTMDLNQPYIHLTIKTIINQCGNDFNICLIDDNSFSRLLPSWDIDLTNVAEPMRTHFRTLGMMELLYYYGGLVVPNSFVCMKNLKSVYEEGLSNNKPFVSEAVNRTVNLKNQKHKLLFVPDLYFCGAQKNDPTILELVEYLKKMYRSPHFEMESDFLGTVSQWCLDAAAKDKLQIVGGQVIGVKTEDKTAILLDNLMEEQFLKLSPYCSGIYIPAEEILNRPKFQWFAYLTGEEVIRSNAIIAKYLTSSIVDTNSEYSKKKTESSIVSI